MIHKKNKDTFTCAECQAQYPKWQGQCPSCKAWNSLKRVQTGPLHTARFDRSGGFAGEKSALTPLSAVAIEKEKRLKSGSAEFDRALGGGFLPGSALLLGGNPGAGKSTLLLQTLGVMSNNQRTLYVSGEESLQQIASRAHRLGLKAHNLRLLAETCVNQIVTLALEYQPDILVIDSIQVMYLDTVDSAPGTLSQVREAAALLTRFAKNRQVVVLMVGHVTKDNSLAGPMTLAHIVDVQLMLSSSDDSRFRILRTLKNRFGQVNELAIFAMTEKGLKDVANPSAIFLSPTKAPKQGSVVCVLWEGTRPLLVELQALVVDSQLANPRRLSLGLDNNRLALLLAVLTRHGNLTTAQQDIFLNVVSGVKITETGADLASLVALVSSLKKRALPPHLVVFGEVGLSGEIRPVTCGQERIYEAAKHGFRKALVPLANQPRSKLDTMEILAVSHISEALRCMEEL